MNIFKRIGDIVSSNVNHALDRMEDPEKMIDLSIRQLEDSIAEMKTMKAEKAAELRSLTERLRDNEAQALRWTERAKIAIEKGHEDMAREAISEKQKITNLTELDKAQLDELETLGVKLDENLKTAYEKLLELKETSTALKTRARIAKERLKVNQKANVSETADYQRRLEELKIRIERWENEADIHHSTLNVEKNSSAPTFEELEKTAEIDRELEELRASLKTEEKKAEN